MRLRFLEKGDLAELVAIEEACSQSPWSLSVLEEALGLDNAWGLGAEEGGALLGFGLFYQVLDELQILTLCVIPSQRRKGLGRSLLEEAKEKGRASGAQKITLEVRKSNEAAQALYVEQGFSPVGIRKAYYSDGEDAILMDCFL